MFYFDFSGTLSRWDVFAHAAVVTVALSSAATVLGLLIGILGAAARRSRNAVARGVAFSYVEIIRNTPFLVQAYVVYFGLPSIGLRLNGVTAAVIALSLYAGAYVTEIVRAGIESIDKGQVEAARALGLSPAQTFRHVILKPAIASVYPALTSQFILIMLASSVVSTISVPELTGAANDIQGLTFRSLEAFLVVAAIYLILTAVFKGVFGVIGRGSFTFKQAAR